MTQTITMQTILSGRITPEELYNSLASPLINSDCTCRELNDSPYRDNDGTLRTYGQVFARLCVDEICATDKRTNPMNEDERWTTAEHIMQTYPYLYVHEITDFTCKVVEAQKESHRGGKSEYAMVNINRYAILERLGIYVQVIRPKSDSAYNPSSQDSSARPTLGAQGDYQRTHDVEGNIMPPGWEANAYWQEIKRTHNYNFRAHQYEYVGDRDINEAIEWWDTKPHPIEIADIGTTRQLADSLAFQMAAV